MGERPFGKKVAFFFPQKGAGGGPQKIFLGPNFGGGGPFFFPQKKKKGKYSEKATLQQSFFYISYLK